MSLSLICPTCTETVTFHHGEENACPHCGVQFDEKLRKQATASLALQTVGRPVLITIGGVLVSLGLGVTLLMMLMALLDVGSFSIDSESVSRDQFILSGGVYLTIQGLLYASLCYAIWTERNWGRPLMLASWVISWAVYAIPNWRVLDAVTLVPGTIVNLIGMGIATWYLYGTERVKAYYKFLAMKAEAKSVSSTPKAPSASPK